MATLQIRANLTPEEQRALNIRAAEKGLTRVEIVTLALHTSPHTADIFTSEETNP